MIIEVDAVPPQPWKNGGGWTRELLRWPAAGNWRLRISLADIEADGPFSAFPGVTRWFAVLEGEGVALEFAGTRRELRPGDAPIRFEGAAAPRCTLLRGPTRDINLMLAGVDGALLAARAGDPAPRWSAVAFFDAATRRLHWPCVDEAAPADGFWIGAAL
jgi:environmental stress-induced protein Ves